MHRIPQRAQLTPRHPHILRPHDVKRPLARPATRRRIRRQIRRLKIRRHLSPALTLKPDRLTTRLVRHLDELRPRFHHKILPPPHHILRQILAQKRQRLLRLIRLTHRDRLDRIVQHHPIPRHPHLLHQVHPKIPSRPLHLPRLIRLRKRQDLPQIAIVPHELPAPQQRATLHRHPLRINLHLALTALARLPVHPDYRPRHPVRLHLPKQHITRPSRLRRRDLNALHTRMRLPQILLPVRIKHMPHKLPAMPRKIHQILPRKHHHPRLLRQHLRQNKPRPMRHHRRVRNQPNRHLPIQPILPRRDRHHPTLPQQRRQPRTIIRLRPSQSQTHPGNKESQVH